MRNNVFPRVDPCKNASDLNNGNMADYCPVRTDYIKVEFNDLGSHTTTSDVDLVDILRDTGPNVAAVKSSIEGAMRNEVRHDVWNHQPQPWS